MTSGCHEALICNRFMPLSTRVRISAPISVPPTVPKPPNSDVPPISTAAMAGRVRSSPMSPCAELIRARMISEASPAMAPLTV